MTSNSCSVRPEKFHPYIQELLPLSALLKVWFPPSQLIPNSQLDPPSQLAPILPNIFHKQVSTECFQFCIEYFPPLFHPKQKLFIKKFKIRYQLGEHSKLILKPKLQSYKTVILLRFCRDMVGNPQSQPKITKNYIKKIT